MHYVRLAALAAVLSFASVLPAAAQGWGALAFSENGTAYAYSRNYDTKEAAEAGALSECAKYAGDCKVYETFQNRCVTLAGAQNGVYGWAWGGNQASRLERALNQCRSHNGQPECKFVIHFCTGTASDDPNGDAPPAQPPQRNDGPGNPGPGNPGPGQPNK